MASSTEILDKYLKETKQYHFNKKQDVDYCVSTGSLIFDIELDGGIHPSILRFSGMSGSGKTSCALSMMKNFLNGGTKKRKGVYVKSEGRLGIQVKDRSGIRFVESAKDWKDGTCFVFKTNVYEVAANLIKQLIEENEEEYQLFFILDSMDALIPQGDVDKDFTEAAKVSGAAGITSHFLKRMALPFSNGGHICALISQVRSEVKINPYQKTDPKLTNASGGNALLHYSDWIFEFQPRYKTDLILEKVDKKEKLIGHWAKIIFRKTPNEKEGQEIRYPIKHHQKNGQSVWREYEIVDIMLMWGMASKKGKWIYLSEEIQGELKQNECDLGEGFDGIDNFRAALLENPKAVDFLFEKFKKHFLDL